MKRRLGNFIYNIDRAYASLVLGAPPQETISSEVGRRRRKARLSRWTAALLDKIQPNHVENAIIHADKLDAADDGQEK
jgi:hypothetical protein